MDTSGLYLASLLEGFVPDVIDCRPFRTGRWKVASRPYRPSPDPG